MKNAWILLFVFFLSHKTNAMKDDEQVTAKIETEKISDENKIEVTVPTEKDESKIEPVISDAETFKRPTRKKKIQLSDAEAEDIKEKFKILYAQKHSKETKLDLYTAGNEWLLQQFMRSFEFGGAMFGKRTNGSMFAFNNAVTFPHKSIYFYKESFDNRSNTKKIKFDLHWNYKFFPLLIEYEKRKFLFRYLHVSEKTDITGEKGIYFFYFNVNAYTTYDPFFAADGIRIIFDDIIFDSQEKRPSFKVKSSNVVKPEAEITSIEASKIIDDAVWFNVEDIQKEVTKKR